MGDGGGSSEAGSRREPDQADDNLHDRGRGVHRITPLLEADGGNAPHGAGGGRLQRQDKAPPRPAGAGDGGWARYSNFIDALPVVSCGFLLASSLILGFGEL